VVKSLAQADSPPCLSVHSKPVQGALDRNGLYRKFRSNASQKAFAASALLLQLFVACHWLGLDMSSTRWPKLAS
jgi:hypothetical protein